MGPRGALAPLANENSHYVNSKMDTVHYCSKRVAPLICLKFKVKLRHCSLAPLLSQTLEDWTFASVPADFFFLFPLQCAEYISWHHDRCSNWEWITSLGTRPWNTIVKVYYLELVNSPQILWEPTASYGFHLKFVQIPDSCLPKSS